MRPTRLGLALLSLALAGTAVAQDSGDGEGETFGGVGIVVTGRNQAETDQRTVTRQARQITRAGDLRHTPLARFADRACPGVTGLKTEYAEMIVTRMRLIAGDLHIPLAPEGACSANVILVFTKDSRADLNQIERKTRLVSELLTVDEKHELLEEDGPVRVFSIVETRMRNGQRIPVRRNLEQIPTGTQEGGQSLIGGGISKVITQSIVLFDRDAVKGMTLRQLADYGAMRVFARTRGAQGEGAPDSILSLFDKDGPAPPEGLTAFDRAYLTTLYRSNPYSPAQGGLQRVARTLQKQLQADE